MSTLGACQVLSLTQSVTDVRSLLYSIMFIGKDDWKTAHWVTLASDEVVCGVVDRLVQHHAWAEARQVVRATLSGTGVTKEEKVCMLHSCAAASVIQVVLKVMGTLLRCD